MKESQPSMDDIMRMAQSPAGKKLIALLQASGNTSVAQAKNAAEKGDYNQAKQNLAHIMKEPKIQALLKEMEQQNGRF